MDQSKMDVVEDKAVCEEPRQDKLEKDVESRILELKNESQLSEAGKWAFSGLIANLLKDLFEGDEHRFVVLLAVTSSY